jgi:transcriptional regulator with XRE-family HTH domain
MTKQLALLLAEKGLRPADLARKCEVEKSTVSRWVENGIPLVRVFQIEKETGIPREKLRPDFFKVDERAPQ